MSIEWWSDDWTEEQKRIAGDPQNRIRHRHKLTRSVDKFERRTDKQLAKEYFNPGK